MSKLSKRKDGRYQTSVYIGVVDGKQKSVPVYGKTQRECRENAAAIKRKLKKGIDITADHDTWADWVNKWFEYQSVTKSEQQMKDYSIYLKHFESLNNIQLNKLQITDFQNIINKLAERNPTTKKPTAKSSLIKFKSAANQVFKFAIENRATDFNPVEYVRIAQKAPKKERRALTITEQSWVENFPHRAQLPAMIMLYSGLRLAECLALQWNDIDFDNKTISVAKTLVLSGKPPYIKQGAKSKAGVRIVDIPQKLIDFLKPLRESPFDYICTNTKGNLYNKSTWRRLWQSYMFDLNFNYGDFSMYINKPKNKYQPTKIPMVIEGFTAHYLRHTHATNLLNAGCDILYVKEQMGHSKIEITLNIYTHLTPQTISNNNWRLDKMLNNRVS